MKHKLNALVTKNNLFVRKENCIIMKGKSLLLLAVFFLITTINVLASDNNILAPDEIDALPTVSFSPMPIPLAISEGIEGVSTITVKLSAKAETEVSVLINFRGVRRGLAEFDVDYNVFPTTQKIIIPAGDISGVMSIKAIDDDISEYNEIVIFEIASVTSNALALGTHRDTITIIDDEKPYVSLSHKYSSFLEAGTDTITATLIHTFPLDVEVELGVGASSTASSVNPEMDFHLTDTIITIPAGQLTGFTKVIIVEDNRIEADETIVIEIENIINGLENGDQELTTTIINNDILPVVRTRSVSYLLASSVTVHGEITTLGSPNPTAYGFCWSKQASPTLANSNTDEGAASKIGSFSSELTSLSSNTKYYVRAYATNAIGTSYGSQITFTTSSLPVISTHVVTDLTKTTVIGHANLSDFGTPSATMYGFCWSTEPDVTVYDNITNNGTAYSIGEFSNTITKLIPGTRYYIRAYAINSGGVTYGYERSFTTLKEPSVSTQSVTTITLNSAKGNGIIEDLGVENPTDHGFCWSIFPDPQLSNGYSTKGQATEIGSYTTDITGLTPGTTYYLRAFATNSVQTSYGNVVSFTTLDLPVITTQNVTEILATSATGNGKIINMGIPNPTSYGVCWSLFANPTIDNFVSDEGIASATGNYSTPMTGLLPGKTYYVRAYASNSAGTAYGDEVSIQMLILPSVETMVVTDITTSTALGGGNISNLGIPNPTAHGVCWGLATEPSLSDNFNDEGAVNATGNFTSQINNLEPGLTYYVRAYASNDAGTIYGNELSFISLKLAEVSTTEITDITEDTALGLGNIIQLGVPNPTAHGFCWSTLNEPTISGFHSNEGQATVVGSFTSSITDLNSGTTYYVRAYATNAAGTVYGNEITFITEQTTTIETGEITEITETSAVINGNIVSLGIPNPVAHGICWSKTSNPTISNICTDLGEATSTGEFSSLITKLNIGTTYYVRAYAIGREGTVYGEEYSFVTLQQSKIETNAVTDITESTAIGNGNITTLGIPAPTSYGVCWSTESGPTIEDNLSDEGLASAIGAFSSEITGLETGTNYFVKAYATNAVTTVYGDEVNFTTQQLPVVSAVEITDITAHTAMFNGVVLSIGIPAATDYGVCWSKSMNPTILDNVTDEGAIRETGAFTSALTNLDYEVVYYARAFANNVLGTVYSEELTFETVKGVGFEDFKYYNVKVYTNNDEIVINADESLEADIAVFNLSGEKILADKMNGFEHQIQFQHRGIFIIKITNSQKAITQKIMF